MPLLGLRLIVDAIGRQAHMPLLWCPLKRRFTLSKWFYIMKKMVFEFEDLVLHVLLSRCSIITYMKQKSKTFLNAYQVFCNT